MSAVDIAGSMIVTLGPRSGVPATACTTGAGRPGVHGTGSREGRDGHSGGGEGDAPTP